MTPTTTKDTTEIQVDVGILYCAPIGTGEPTAATSVLDAAWREIGYTDDGSAFSTEVDSQPIKVEELLDPVRFVNVGRVSKLKFAMAQMVRSNLGLALNQGAAVADNATVLGPAATSAEVRVMLLWLSEQTGASRYGLLARQCYNTGGLTIDNKQAPAKRLIPVEFSLEKPTSADAWSFLPSNAGAV